MKLSSSEMVKNAGLRIVTVEKRPIRETLDCNGEIVFARNLYARVSSRVPAVIAEVRKDLGDSVSAGETLAVLDSVDLGVAKAEYLKLLETTAVAHEKVDRAKSYFERLNRMEVRLAAVELLKARELLAVSEKNAAREERLMQRQSGSQRALLDAQAAFSVARANLRALEKKLILFGIPAETLSQLKWGGIEKLEGRGVTSEQELLSARIELRSSQARLDAARRRLLTLGLSTESVAELANSKDTSSLLPVVAPFSGRVVELKAVIGEVVDSRTPLFGIADSSKMWAMLDIYPRDLARVHLGQSVSFRVDGLRGESFGGRVTWISPQVDRKTRTIKLRAELDNSSGLLRAEMFGKGRVTIHDPAEPVVMIPKEAVQWEGCCNVAFIRKTDRVYETRKLRLGMETDDAYVVEMGLKGGESVVTTGSFFLKTEILKGNIGAGCGCVDGK